MKHSLLRFNIMPRSETNHNANLLNTLPNHTPIVNIDLLDGNGNVAGIDVKNAPTKLFVPIDNNIYNHKLSPRTLEFYCQLAYLILAYPKVRLSILKIQSLIIEYTNKKINKNSINKYLKTLGSKGLLSRNSTCLVLHKVMVTPTEQLESIFIEDVKSNIYQAPKVRYTNFYILAYNHDTTRCSLVLELYFASKPYNWHRPSKVCKDLNITLKTYYKYLRELVSKNIIKKNKVNYKKNIYINSKRELHKKISIDIQSTREWYLNDEWYEKRKLKQQKIERGEQKPTAHSRIWYFSKMGPIMSKYGINYIPLFDSYDPDIAYTIVEELIEQYRRKSLPVNASMIVAALKMGYNSIKIADREHAKFKREESKMDVFTWAHR